MPTPTYDLIESTALGSSASSITFSSIPSTYRDLVLVIDVIGTDSSVNTLYARSILILEATTILFLYTELLVI
jgi:hypothetical protein